MLQRDHLNLIFIQLALDFCARQYLFDLSLGLCVVLPLKNKWLALKKPCGGSEKSLLALRGRGGSWGQELPGQKKEDARQIEREAQQGAAAQAPALGALTGRIEQAPASEVMGTHQRSCLPRLGQGNLFISSFISILSRLIWSFLRLKRLKHFHFYSSFFGGFVLFWLVWGTW